MPPNSEDTIYSSNPDTPKLNSVPEKRKGGREKCGLLVSWGERNGVERGERVWKYLNLHTWDFYTQQELYLL